MLSAVEYRRLCVASRAIYLARIEVHRSAVALKLLPSPERATNDTPVDPPKVSGSPLYKDDPGAEEKLQRLLANADTSFTCLDLLFRPLFTRYKISHISSISTLTTSVGKKVCAQE